MTSAPRFYQSGGQLFADRRPVSLEWARETIKRWHDEAYRSRLYGNSRLDLEYRRQAETLQTAVFEVMRWQRASGPNAAEAYTRTVERMLRASVEQGS